ncbi:MAG: 50S ribosomal protein L30 [Dehalococcoidia bacterium]|nr:50S ribosomal protein L30 [Dehalococcoidia bacterium]MCA9823909.1 50S ribosomal protein L30 [Dehalococcoidia bacterium]MCA9844049.1 50S ribosomal protein L30 [Dehalococcoidia bacterium]MCA9854325.1 50S ribosomal protein L30 [Dehalococcoidia bacterium]
MSDVIKVTWRKSAIGYRQSQKDTIRKLGFRRLGQTVEKPDTPAIRGMVDAVSHLVEVEEETS